MGEPSRHQTRSWLGKFRGAFHGIWLGVRGQSSFVVHIPVAILVGLLAVFFGVSTLEGCLLALCATTVLATEMFNSALESLAKAIDQEYNAHLATALDVASGAVLVAAIGAAGVGLAIFVPHVLKLVAALSI